MRRAALVKELRRIAKANGVDIVHTGGRKHEKWTLGDKTIMIPRHKEIAEGLAKTIIKLAREAK